MLVFIMLCAAFFSFTTNSYSTNASNSWDMIKRMSKGINLGNTLESPYEGEWAAAAKEYYFDDFKTAGFDSVRIPVRWDKHMGTEYPYTIDSTWLDRVEQIVDWSLSRGFVTILNSHHDDWIKENYSGNIERFEKLWEQVSDRFKDKSENLVFEICNEPFGNITDEEINDMNSRILEIIRVKNPIRYVIIGGGKWNDYNTLISSVDIPSDPYIIGTFHFYVPQSFTQLSMGTWGSDEDKQVVKTIFDNVQNWSLQNNVPVLLGEFAVMAYADRESRIKYYDYISDEALRHGFAFSVWDNGTIGTAEYDMCFYDRSTGLFDTPILDALINTPVTTPCTTLPTSTPKPTKVPATPAIGEKLLLDFEDEVQIKYWLPYSMQASVSSAFSEGNNGGGMKVSYTGSNIGYWGVATLVPDGDWSAWQKISFDIKSENSNPIRLIITETGTISGQDGEHWEYSITPSNTWSTVTIPFKSFTKRLDHQPPVEDMSKTFDLNKLNNIHFASVNDGSDTFYLDNIKVIGLDPGSTENPVNTPTITPNTPTPDKIAISGYVNPDVVSGNIKIKAGFKIEVLGTSYSVLSDSSGYFKLEEIPMEKDKYNIKISKPGYLARIITGIPGTHSSQIGSQNSPVVLWAGDMPIKGIQNNVINLQDIIDIAMSFNCISGGKWYSNVRDLNMDGAINLIDIMLVLKNFNRTSDNYPAITPVSSNVSACVSIDGSKSLNSFADTGVGVNTGIFDEFLLGKDLPGRLMDAGIKVCRYPDGIPSDQYHWKTHTLDPNPQEIWLAPNAKFDDYMTMVKKSKGEALVTVNYGSGTPEEAADWVSYANNTKNYNVKYWEIGNEIYGNGFYGSKWTVDLHEDKSPTGYATNALNYIKAMKAVDPSIKIGVPLIIPGDWPGGITPDWNSTVLSILGTQIDFVIIHFYPQQPMQERDSYLLSCTDEIEGKISKLRTQLNKYCGDKADQIQIWVTETNSSLPPGSKQQLSVVSSLFIADNYASWLKNGASNVTWESLHLGPVVDGNNNSYLYGDTNYGDWGILANGMGADYVKDGWPTGKSNLVEPVAPPLDTPYPVWYGLKMLNYLATPGDKFISASSDQPLVTVHAVKQANGKLSVLLINKSPDEVYDVNISIKGFTPSRNGRVYSFGKQSNSIETEVVRNIGNTFTQTVAPYSLTTIVLNPKK
jgi:endoglucanase